MEYVMRSRPSRLAASRLASYCTVERGRTLGGLCWVSWRSASSRFPVSSEFTQCTRKAAYISVSSPTTSPRCSAQWVWTTSCPESSQALTVLATSSQVSSPSPSLNEPVVARSCSGPPQLRPAPWQSWPVSTISNRKGTRPLRSSPSSVCSCSTLGSRLDGWE